MEKRYVVGLGEVLWDVLPEGKKLGVKMLEMISNTIVYTAFMQEK